MISNISKVPYSYRLLGIVLVLFVVGCSTKQESSNAYVANAKQYFEEGKPELALVEVRNAIRIDPKNGDAYYTAALVQEELQQWQGMHNNLQRLLEVEPNHTEAKFKLARLLFLAGDTDKAAKLSKELLSLEPKTAKYIALEAAIRFKEGNAEEALALAKTAIELDPSNMEATGIAIALEIAASNYAAAHRAISEAELITPNSLELLTLRARVQAGERDLTAMAETFRRMIEIRPEELNYRRALASVLLQTEGRDAALAVLTNAVSDIRDSVTAKLMLARFIAEEDQAAAIQQLRTFAAQSPKEAKLQLSLAEALTELGNLQEAYATYNELATSEISRPTTTAAKSEMARIALTNNDSAAASMIVDEVLDLDPDHPEALLLKSFISATNRDFDEGISTLRRVLRNEPENDRALELLGRIYLMQQSIPLAKESFNAALSANPYNAPAANHQAKLLMREGKLEDAAKLLRPVVSADRGDPESHRLLIQLELSMKNWNDAESIAKAYPNAAIRENVSLLVKALIDQGRGNYEEAIHTYRNLLDVPSVRDAALAGIISSYSESGEKEAPISLLQDLLEDNPKDRVVIKLLAQEMRISNVPPEELLRFWEEQLARNADWAEGFIEYGNQQGAGGDYKGAYTAYLQSYELQPTTGTKLRMTFALEQAGELEEAKTLYRELLGSAPNSLLIRNNLAMLLSKDEATRQEALTIAQPLASTDQPYFLDTIGWLYSLNGENDKAVELLRQAVALAPETGEFRFHLGSARYQLKQIDQAKSDISVALEKPKGSLIVEDWRDQASLLLQQM